ncbi:MAG: hypothetical protein H7841_10425 [Magnetospirillum sp. WYHS-4]
MMDWYGFGQRARTLVDLWNTRTAESRSRVLSEIREQALLALWVLELLPPRDETNDRNELAFALAQTAGQGGGPSLQILTHRAEELAKQWQEDSMEVRARVLREIHRDGALALWVFDLLPSLETSGARSELGSSLVALYDTMEARKGSVPAPAQSP